MIRVVTLRPVLRVLALAALVAMGIEPRLLQMPFLDRPSYEREMTDLPDRKWPQYPRFLDGVRAHTRPGDTIAVIVPDTDWEDGYSYAYYRASYFLTGREVLPFINRRNERLPQNLRAARYVAAFGVRVTLRGPAELVWQGEGGTLVRTDSGLQR